MGFYFSTRFDVEYLNNTYKFAIQKVIPMEHSGFYSRFHKRNSSKGEVITIGSYHFIIEEATNKKIELVKMTRQSDFFRKIKISCKKKRY
jgi:Mg2+/Co2+ transporter CorC